MTGPIGAPAPRRGRRLRGGRPGRWRRRRTARLRLTLLYSGMFLGLGTAAVAVIFLLSSAGSPIHISVGNGSTAVQAAPSSRPPAALRLVPDAPQVLKLQRSADLARQLTVSWLVMAITAVVSAAVGWWASGRVLRPLRQMTATARTISARNLGERLALAGPEDEFKQLGDTLDELLARLQAAFEAQRRFVANASHELRTPLTLDRTLLQVALADPDADADALRATCREVLASGREQERLLEALLTLATSERGLDHRHALDLATLTGRAVHDARGEAERRSLELVTALDPAPAQGDPALVERLAVNLIDNAVRYNEPGGRVEVRTRTDNGHSLLTVANTGPQVPADAVERLFEPFQRLNGLRTDGADGHHGLGLSIVRAIATAHGGTVAAQPGEGGGLTVTVSFVREGDAGRPRTPEPPVETPGTAG